MQLTRLRQPTIQQICKEKKMKRSFALISVLVLMLVLASFGSKATGSPNQATMAATSGAGGLDQYGERYDADPAVLKKSVGTTDGVPKIALAALYRAGLPVDQATMDLAVKCWKE